MRDKSATPRLNPYLQTMLSAEGVIGKTIESVELCRTEDGMNFVFAFSDGSQWDWTISNAPETTFMMTHIIHPPKAEGEAIQ
jgi:hypothetical protein